MYLVRKLTEFYTCRLLKMIEFTQNLPIYTNGYSHILCGVAICRGVNFHWHTGRSFKHWSTGHTRVFLQPTNLRMDLKYSLAAIKLINHCLWDGSWLRWNFSWILGLYVAKYFLTRCPLNIAIFTLYQRPKNLLWPCV